VQLVLLLVQVLQLQLRVLLLLRVLLRHRLLVQLRADLFYLLVLL
jgi:hypothetical protein